MRTKEELQQFLKKAIKLTIISEKQRTEREIRVYSVAQGMIAATSFALGDIEDEISTMIDEIGTMIDEMDKTIAMKKH